MEWLKNFDLNRRWNVAIAAGLAITLAAIAAKNREGILIGLGIFGLGVGERMNPPQDYGMGERRNSHIFSSRQPADGFDRDRDRRRAFHHWLIRRDTILNFR